MIGTIVKSHIPLILVDKTEFSPVAAVTKTTLYACKLAYAFTRSTFFMPFISRMLMYTYLFAYQAFFPFYSSTKQNKRLSDIKYEEHLISIYHVVIVL